MGAAIFKSHDYGSFDYNLLSLLILLLLGYMFNVSAFHSFYKASVNKCCSIKGTVSYF